MDYSHLGAATGIISIVIHVVEKVIMIVNHKRVRSKCCGKQIDSSLDIEETTPPAASVTTVEKISV